MGLMPVVIGQERDFGKFKWQSRESVNPGWVIAANTNENKGELNHRVAGD